MTNRNDQIMAQAFNYAGPSYTVDSKGRKVRQFCELDPCTPELIRQFYIDSVRACSETEALEAIGENAFRYAVKRGYLVKMTNSNLFAITEKCAKAKKLPRPRLLNGGPLCNWLK